jgi:hypothetical protein
MATLVLTQHASARKYLQSTPAPAVWLQAILLVAFYTFAANLPYWTAAHLLHLLPLGWITLEYLIVGLLALVIPRFPAAFLLLLALAADLTAGISRTYHLHPYECFFNLTVLDNLPPQRLLATAIVTVLCCLIVAIPICFPASKLPVAIRRRNAFVLVALCLIAIGTDVVRMQQDFRTIRLFGPITRNDVNHISDWGNLWVARYPVIHLLRDPQLFPPMHAKMDRTLADTPPILGATSIALNDTQLLALHPGTTRPNFVLILVESWGIANDPKLHDRLTLPYNQPELLAKYRVLQGTIPFHGATVGGETRELCQSTAGIEVLKIPADRLKSCLPDTLRALGYTTTALHGMDARVFNRINWYPRIGFQQQRFGQDFRALNLPDCSGAFVGTCDADIARFLQQSLATPAPNPQFLYWVTLNSHLPVPIPPPLAHPATCPIADADPNARSLCSWFQLVANVHTSVAEMALASPARPTIFVIVGDHAPPFNSAALNAQFNQATVPYVILIPR